MMKLRPLSLLILFLVLLCAVPVEAHRVSSVSLVSYLDTEKKTYVLDVAMEVVPSEDQALNDQISPEDAAREFAEEFLVVMFDREDQKPEMEIRIESASDAETPPELVRQQVLTKLSGAIPVGAKEFLLYLDPRCPMAVVMVVIKDAQPNRRMQVILAGEYSRPVSVAPVEKGDPFAASPTEMETKADPKSQVKPVVSARSGTFSGGWRSFLGEGALPSLLVIGLLLLTLSRRSVFLQVATLLVTMSLAIVLVAWKIITVPGWISIALVVMVMGLTLESLFHRQMRWWRIPLVAGGGTFLGFTITETSPFRVLLGSSQFGTGDLVRFLLGAESALILVTLVAASVFLLLSRFEWYRRAVVQPLAVLVTGYALFSAVEVYL